MPFESSDFAKLMLALLLGGAIGLEREFRGKSAGFRTIILITLGSALFSIVSLKISDASSADRIAANLVVGIGFLGGGVIFKEENRVAGLTTASTIWISAALGLCIGSGFWQLSLCVAAIVLVVLICLPLVERYIDLANQSKTYRIVRAYNQETLHHYETLFRSHHLKAYSVKQSIAGGDIIGTWHVIGAKKNHERLISDLLEDKDLRKLDF